jgi:hypothetical protein
MLLLFISKGFGFIGLYILKFTTTILSEATFPIILSSINVIALIFQFRAIKLYHMYICIYIPQNFNDLYLGTYVTDPWYQLKLKKLSPFIILKR